MPPRRKGPELPRPTLDIQLLGDFRLCRAGMVLAGASSARLQALLAFLLLHQECPQSRQHLAFLFWPDSSEAKARNNLRQLLFDLRHILPDAECFVEVGTTTVQWRADAPFTLDVYDLEKAIAEAARALRENDRDCAQVALEQAVALYLGDLLPGCYDDWITVPREHLRQVFIAALGTLIRVLEEKRDYAAAIRYAQRLLHQDPLQETAYQQLMRLHAASGDRAGVVRVFQTCAAVLKREMDVPPSPETCQVYEALQSRPPAAPPVLSAVTSVKNNLPVPLTQFVGRSREIAEIKHLCSEQRLLTLTGAGGVGKTRLALAVAKELVDLYADGVWLVDFSQLTDPALVPHAVASVLGVQEKKGSPLGSLLAEHLRDKSLLLVLDNCEHLIDACAHLVANLVSYAANIHILVTSRELIGIPGERAWRVPSLAIPSAEDLAALAGKPASILLEHDSIRLFVDRATGTLPTFSLTPGNASAIAQICQELDGIPLAIELAAARLKVLSAEQVADRLNDRFRLLSDAGRIAVPRHKTLRAAIDWSYDLLSEPEQTLFQQLSVFAGGFTLETAAAICADQNPREPIAALDLLSRLIDKSLVAVQGNPAEVRYGMLETLRQYAQEKLIQSGQAESLRDRHSSYFLAFAEEADRRLRGPHQIEWLDRLDVEYANVSAAMEWALAKDDTVVCHRFSSALWYYWIIRGPWTEGRERLRRVLETKSSPDTSLALTRVLLGAGYLAYFQGDYEAALGSFGRSIELAKSIGDKNSLSEALYGMGTVGRAQGNLEKAERYFGDGLALSRQGDDRRGIGSGLLNLGFLRLSQGDYAAARAFLEPSLGAFREVGDIRGIAKVLGNLGLIAYYKGNYAEARPLFEEALALNGQLRDKRALAGQLDNLGYIALHESECDKAQDLFRQSLGHLHQVGDKPSIADVLHGLAGVAAAQSSGVRAARLLGAASALLQQLGTPIQPMNTAEYDWINSYTREQIEPAKFEAAYARGRAMSLREAIKCALGDIEE